MVHAMTCLPRPGRCRSSRLRPSRRRFLASTSAVAGAVWASGPAILRAQRGDKLRLAVIGSGGRGGANLKDVAGEHIAALCDVDRQTLAKASALYPAARTEVDFRRLFDQPGEFDAVVVSTSEHTHAFATLPALQLKKHVYCEKPLTHNVQEARIIREAAAKAGVATQMGTQIHASDNYRRVVELIQSGAIGKVTRVPCVGVARVGPAAARRRPPQHKDIVFVQERPTDRRPRPGRPRLGSVARPRASASVQRCLFPRAEMVSLVGLRQRHDE